MIKEAINIIVSGNSLTMEQAAAVMNEIMNGEATPAQFGAFVTALRVTLTRSIYPNLHADADANQQAALRAALEQVALELPRARRALDAEYHAATED